MSIGQACLAQVLLALLWAGSPAPYIDCQLTVTCVLTTNFPPPALCANLHIVLHCPALYCPLYGNLLLHCIAPACIAPPPCQSVSRQKPFVSLAASTLFVEEAAFCFNCPRKASSRPYWPKPLLRHWTLLFWLKTPRRPRPFVGFTVNSVKRCLFKETLILV